MKKVYLIRIETKPIQVRVKADNLLTWFDSDKNEIVTFRGGKLVPVFDYEQKKIKPKVEDVYEYKYENRSNREDILNWVKNYGSRYGLDLNQSDSDNKYIATETDISNASIVEYVLDRSNFSYEVS